MYKRFFRTTKSFTPSAYNLIKKENPHIFYEKELNLIKDLILKKNKEILYNQKKILFNQRLLLSIHIGTGTYAICSYCKDK